MRNDRTARQQALAEKACAFLSAATDPFHAVFHSVAKLQAAGFVELPTQQQLFDQVVIQPGGKYYYTVYHSTLVAFTVGKHYQPGLGGFHILGGHTDSPNLAIKPRSKKTNQHNDKNNNSGCIQLAVQLYGGGMWHTWLDRDLGVSGKVLVRTSNVEPTTTTTTDNMYARISSQLVQIKEPVARISNLCTHLQTDQERTALRLNKELHTSPIVATTTTTTNSSSTSSMPTSSSDSSLELPQAVTQQINGGDSWTQGQEPLLLVRIAEELGISVAQIADFELSLFDTQPAAIGGLQRDFIYSARLDNLATVFCAIEALVDHASAAEASSTSHEDHDIAMVVCFDHEEVGSVSSHGAGSPVLVEAIRRVTAALGADQSPAVYAQTISRSFCWSSDMSHAIHPNYPEKHDTNHAPLMNQGVVVKTNCNQRYMTNGLTGFIVRELGRKVGVPIQEYAGMCARAMALLLCPLGCL
jgi:aspartyl aminopeptidase